MKRKLTLLLVATVCVFGMNGQIVLNQNFNATNSVITTPASGSWVRVNNSQPVGSTSWFIGNPGVFTAYNGADSAYFAANFYSTLGTGTISSWLITPTVTLANGGILQFATRTTSTTVNPDRLSVYMSQGTGTNVGNSATTLGTFTTELVTVNPNLTTSGYPGTWTVYQTTLTGITGTVAGRFGFRYHVPAAGPTGTNSSYIGLDAVQYGLPCANPTLTISSSTTGICSGNTAVITASGATTYTWSNGSNSPSITVSPTATAVYSLEASSIPNCNSTGSIVITATMTPDLAVTNVTTCPGTAATLVVTGATTYSWDNGATTATTAVTPTMATTYTVTGYNGSCEDTELVSVALGASLSINAAASASVVCSGSPVTLMGMGATTYSWAPGTATTPSTVANPTVATIYTLSAASGTCLGKATVSVGIIPLPTITVVPATPAVICVLTTLTLTANGGATYSWSSGSTQTTISVMTPTALTSPTSTVPQVFTVSVVGTGTNGCSASAIVTRTLSACTGIEGISKETVSVSAYPNPFINELKIAGNGAAKVEFYNSLGQLVTVQKLTAAESVSTTDLSKGIYILKVFNSDEKLLGTIKAVKN